MVVAVIVLSIVLQEPVAGLFPAETPRWMLFFVIAVPIVAAIGIGLSIAYPRVRVDADGALRVRGRRVLPSELVAVRRSVSSGGGSTYLVYTLETSAGRRIRVLVAGAPIRGLGSAELGVLREAVAASSIPVGADTAELERAFIGANLLATGRRTEADRRLVLRELDELRGVPYRPDAESAAAAHVAAPHASSAPDQGSGLGDDDRDVGREADDLEAEQQLTAAARTRTPRRVALGVFVLVCVATAALLVVLVVMESLGTDFGAAGEDPLVAAMSVTILAALLTGILWATAADFDDARRRALSREWLEAASPEQLVRGLPTPFHAAWMRAPGGRLGSLGLLVLGMMALLAVIGGPVALAGAYAPWFVGVIATAIGVVLGGVALWAWFARRRAYARRIEWLLEVAGRRVSDDNSLAG
jgi:hypothetical protein